MITEKWLFSCNERISAYDMYYESDDQFQFGGGGIPDECCFDDRFNTSGSGAGDGCSAGTIHGLGG